jgi:acyl carrier protein phosphodiesterase
MIEQNWLVSYRHFEVVGKALHRISRRLSRPLPLADATEDLVRDEDLLKSDFREFMREAGRFVREETVRNPF